MRMSTKDAYPFANPAKNLMLELACPAAAMWSLGPRQRLDIAQIKNGNTADKNSLIYATISVAYIFFIC